MTDKELWQAAWKELELTTDSYPRWKSKGFPSASHWAKAKALGDQIGTVEPYLSQDWSQGVSFPWLKEGQPASFATAPGKLTLTTGPGSSGPNPSSYMASAYVNPQFAHAEPGAQTTYRVPITFPVGYKATAGEWNWIVVWHVSDPTPQALSCGLGVFADGPIKDGNDPPGTNPRLFFVVRGGSVTNLTEKRFTMPTTLPLGVQQTHEFSFRWERAPTVGNFTWKIDGATVWSVAALNMLNDGLPNGFGLYNYRRLATWDASVQFGAVKVEKT